MKRISVIMITLLLVGCKTPIEKQNIVLDRRIEEVKESVSRQKKQIKDIREEARICQNEMLNKKIDELDGEIQQQEGRINELKFDKDLLILLANNEIDSYNRLKNILKIGVLLAVVFLAMKKRFLI